MEHPKVRVHLEKPETKLRVVVCGETTCGKTSIVRKFTDESSYHNVDSTIGASFSKKIIEIEGRRIRFEIWVQKLRKF